MKCSKNDLLLYAVTDRSWLDGREMKEVIRESLEGGVTFLQLREKKLSREEFLAEAREIRELCHEYNVPFIVNDDVEIARLVDADGVHVGQSDMEAGLVREQLGDDKIIGVSARTVDQALLAQERGADYLGVGAVFGTSTKDDAKKLELETVKAICEAVTIPVVAIGGVSLENIKELKGSGVCGAAVVSAIYAQPDIKKAAMELKKELKKVVSDN